MATELHKTTVNLIPKTVGSLGRLHEHTGLSKTDIINRAVQLYDFIDSEVAVGRSFLLRSPDGTTETLRII